MPLLHQPQLDDKVHSAPLLEDDTLHSAFNLVPGFALPDVRNNNSSLWN